MEIRSYQDKDFLDLERILKKTDLYEEEFDQRENYKHQIEYDSKSILVATEGDKVLGGVISLYNPFASFIFHLCVNPEYQNKGIGTKLMDEAEKNLLERGVAIPVIYVDKENEKVTNFYKKRHWELCPDAIPMVKKIK
ncbi:MAG: GNAT family N-acetyltransferase [Nanoarchaeota archaeon]|nr:GNAT family N-acetyltransferase [Nanoarchaeota archaeon]MBU4352444.1 GNAT family N-acetyltransferase [Nanoarchaeota archaeon]MBU4456961.1 GNAT family N-acetyltransferase [Nanoarchaeota archaeon]MCG2720036.1 GNAT family N-acetyltransferase [Nanoarchaeota archaeon]